MTESVDRRNPKVARVPLATLVDICARDKDLPPFQGQSGNISGRGMHVRTSHLPEIGTPLVCRFEHDTREILVEGRVAWRSEGEDGGEFGVQFTAVDADSAEILRSLRPMSSVSSAFAARSTKATRSTDEDEDEDEDLLLLKSGDRVRLHIDGLAAPMKARVHEGGRQKVRLGSNLEFLKVGRPVEVENVDDGNRRGAKVDSVNVVLNPSTSVPELVVMLRYEGEAGSPVPALTRDVHAEEADSDDAFEDEGPLAEATDALKARMLGALSGAKSALRWARSTANKVGDETKRTMSLARERLGETGDAGKPAAPRPLRAQTPRKTAQVPRPSNVARAGIQPKRPSSSAASGRSAAPPQPKAKSIKALTIGGIVLLGLTAWGTHSLSGEKPPALAHTTKEDPKAAPGAPMAGDPPAPGQAPGSAMASAATTGPAPQGLAPGASPSARNTALPPRPNVEGIVAEVPLFGPRPITTSEPVAPSLGEALEEKRAAAASVPDEKFVSAEKPAAKEATSWGRGQLHLPTVHRIRLDAAGAEIVGVAEDNGFAIVVPGRKAMETGRAIEKRDRRILHVKTSNTAEGARINFAFRGPVPPYRVRLKNDFVEFFVSAPEGLRAEP